MRVLEHACTLVNSLENVDEDLKMEARTRLLSAMNIIFESELHQETVADEKELDINHLSPEERVEIEAQLQTVLEKIRELEEEKGVVPDDILWDTLFQENGIKRRRVADLVAILMSKGSMRARNNRCSKLQIQ